MDAAADERLLAPYRVMRRIAPPEAPWPGLLVRAGDDALTLVSTGDLGDDWPGWCADPGGHVLAPVDVVRRRAGHDAALPVCTARLLDVLESRRLEGFSLDAGEAVTIAVSILRGVAQLSVSGPGAKGEWWLTEGGMPVVAVGAGFTLPAAVAGAEILRAVLPCSREIDDALEDACAMLEGPSPDRRALAVAESRLFERATPSALRSADRSLRRRRVSELPSTTADEVFAERPRGALQRLAHHVDDGLADLVSVVTTAVWRRMTRPGSTRGRRPVIVAAGIAAVILAGGLAWPWPDGPAPAEAIPLPAAADSADPAGHDPAGHEEPTPTATAATGLATLAAELLTLRSECQDDQACLSRLVEDPGEVFPEGVVDLPAEQRAVALLDDFGGAAVLRVDATAGNLPYQFVVIVLRDGEWLVRDVMDVADQP
jgi:hypothetical protein